MRKLVDTPELRRVRPVKGRVGQNSEHESAVKHVTGKAQYVDDLPEIQGVLHTAVGGSAYPHARIVSMDLSRVLSAPGVVDVITAGDVPGHLDIGPVFPGDPVLVERECEYIGQPIFAVAATSFEAAKQAVKLARIEYEELPAVLDVSDGLKDEFFVRPPHSQISGDADSAIQAAPFRLSGRQYVKGQEHFYLEGQASMVVPTEDGGMMVYTSSQHPTEVQKLVAEVLGLSINQVQVEVRRMGGGFGGKETQAAPVACIASILASRTGRPVKYRMSRQDDMVMTGKRHDFLNSYEVGFDESGRILGTRINVSGKCGNSPDLSDAIVDRAMFHACNAYFLGEANVTGYRCKTHTVSNTAFRGFGGPQGMMIGEQMVEDIAYHLGIDPLEVRKQNLFGKDERNTTHYGQLVEDLMLGEMMSQLEDESDYQARRKDIIAFNQTSPFLKKGLALTPVMFGISFTVQHLNQAGALLHIYTDGSLHLNHGGTEMGQGLFTKVAQVVAEEFQVDLDRIAVSATRTDKVPNTSPTAASSGSDLNGMAARDACLTIKARLLEFAAGHYGVNEDQVRFENNHVVITGSSQADESGELWVSFADFVQLAYMNRISLSSTGFYKTPKIHYDRETGKGRPFFYYANGAAVSEVIVDTLTGEYKVLRVDILHDVGSSLNPAIDIGQIEGGFVQGMGWLTTEELQWDDAGHLISNSPANYKIPTAGDIPEDFRVTLVNNHPNPEATIYRSKAVGEPPFMLAISVWSAIRNAVASLADYRYAPPLDPPATPERVLSAVTATRQHLAQQKAKIEEGAK
ncbi:xanthine dehydrogenase molybdopterin binding subunit [Hahella sp. CCB-MM4]|uniref:xanthine dehydrogenase molybdopterin binding subunit n=1 Tax=Hahella sp. (strain CCB-MM4) TaxID=1926491 RepID=UPI000B9C0D33|nr:xanthine dehydrogenase molybdopterin binding subunit [Hahella sp. CCB-MM4]OZG70259.1 xanthine dehydrogenase molybdopterin binding subunit [Hahella sp. CCB-MM4]